MYTMLVSLFLYKLAFEERTRSRMSVNGLGRLPLVSKKGLVGTCCT